MLHIAVVLQLFALQLVDRARTKLLSTPERGSETVEKVLWAVGAIVLAGIVFAAVKTYVIDAAGKISGGVPTAK